MFPLKLSATQSISNLFDKTKATTTTNRNVLFSLSDAMPVNLGPAPFMIASHSGLFFRKIAFPFPFHHMRLKCEKCLSISILPRNFLFYYYFFIKSSEKQLNESIKTIL